LAWTFLTQGYAWWKPVESLQRLLGMFASPFGAEGLDESSRGTADVADDLYANAWFESVLGVVVLRSS
jgi:hypothetical protein